MERLTTRRTLLGLLAGLPLLAAGTVPSRAAERAAIARLIARAASRGSVSARMAFISGALLGVAYREHTLIGGPRRPETFVVRDDAFDCVTFCEFVLAAAISHDYAAFEAALRRIRYWHGEVQWNRRNHLFADWCARNVGNGICERVAIAGAEPVAKTMPAVGLPGRRHWSLEGIPPRVLLANRARLADGDIVGFVSRRASLDYFHAGLLSLPKAGGLVLRHASQSHGRVLDEDMASFLAVNGVRYVTLLRPADKPPARESL